MPDVELRHFRSFLALSEELSFTAAARRLFITQQTLSRTIAQMERLIGHELFERSTRSVTLTPAGTAMIEAAEKAVLAADQAVHTARSHGGATRVRVDVSSGGLETGGLILREMRSRHPDIGIHQVEVGVRRGIEELRAGRLDVVLGLKPAAVVDVAAELVRREPVLIAMSDTHPLARNAEVEVARLAEYPLLLPDPDAAAEWIDFVTDFCRQADIEPRQWPHVTHGSAAAAEALREGVCVTPTNAWLDPPADLAFRTLTNPTPVFSWSLMWSNDSPTAGPAQLLRECARDVGRRLAWPTS